MKAVEAKVFCQMAATLDIKYSNDISDSVQTIFTCVPVSINSNMMN